jgi:histidine ammonia-lyase
MGQLVPGRTLPMGDAGLSTAARSSATPALTSTPAAGARLLTGRDLTPDHLRAIARGGASVEVDGSARARMAAAHQVVERAIAAGEPVYGLTRGLGSRVDEPIAADDVTEFSLRTLRGRAMAVGEPLPTEIVRAAMTVRLNGLCAGGAGASTLVADALAAMLNAGVHPIVPRNGSVGAADVCLLAAIGLVLVGEGEAEFAGERLPAGTALARAGLAAIELGPRDGLAICSSCAVSIGTAVFALLDARDLLDAAQAAAALSMEGFRANLSPIDVRAVAARAAPGQRWSASGLRALLAGGELTAPGAARRLQDPLSFRCASQIHGSLHTALELLEATLTPELGGAADNPLVITDDDELIGTGNFHVPAMALALDAVAIALTQVASASSARTARLMEQRLSGLSANLAPIPAGRSGLAPLHKTAQSLTVEIRHLAAPLSLDPYTGAEGVEDDATNAVHAALRVREQLELFTLLTALELVLAAQAVELAAPRRLGIGTAAAYECVRELSAPLHDDRPMGADVELVAREALHNRRLITRIDAALSRV